MNVLIPLAAAVVLFVAGGTSYSRYIGRGFGERRREECGDSVSLVIAARDEEESLVPLVEEIVEVGLSALPGFELLLIDDGSRDRTPDTIKGLVAKHSFIRGYRLEKSQGKSAAWHLGFTRARGDIIITMDGDLQNDPRDVALLLRHLEEGYDLVSGQRRRRHDTLWRKIQSRIANTVRRTVLGDSAYDSGCGLKVFRRACLSDMHLFKGYHRFMEALFHIHGFRVSHLAVNDRPRTYGSPKFGLKNRIVWPFLDMLGVFWLKKRRIAYRFQQITPPQKEP
jgi:dolichol-phosphate mannosyltransferase